MLSGAIEASAPKTRKIPDANNTSIFSSINNAFSNRNSGSSTTTPPGKNTSNSKQSAALLRSTEMQGILDSSAFSIIEFMKAHAALKSVDDIVLSSQSEVENNCKVSNWELLAGISISSSVPINTPDEDGLSSNNNNKAKSSSNSSWFPPLFSSRSQSLRDKNLFGKTNNNQNRCADCNSKFAFSPSSINRSNSGVSDFEGIGKNYCLEASPADPVSWKILENVVASL